MVPGPKARMQDPLLFGEVGQGARLQWCPARRPGCRCSTGSKWAKLFKGFNGARPEGQDAGVDRLRRADLVRGASMVPGPKARMQVTQCSRRIVEVHASMVPGPKARMQGPVPTHGRLVLPASMVPGPKARMQGAACRCHHRGPTASMVPGPKARMQEEIVFRVVAATDELQWCPARRPGCRSVWRVVDTSLTALQWCPARRPGCRTRTRPPRRRWPRRFNGARPEGQDAGPERSPHVHAPVRASMVPGPKARMQAAGGSWLRRFCSGFNGARPEGQDAG